MMGTVFSIEEFAVYDGPGIRTSVFLKGCPLRCSWCHNPEGQLLEPQIVRSPNGCVNCGNCIKYAIKTDDGIKYSDESVKNCPRNLLRISGDILSSQDIFNTVMKNERILKNGGVTFSGGEPLMQSEFVIECLRLFKGRLHTAVQTCGYCDDTTFKTVLELSDYFLYDLKIIDEKLHKKYTGVSNKRIINNFKTLAKSNKDFVVRIPLIPTITDTTANITDIAVLLADYGINYAELMPYNKMAGGKYSMVGRTYSPDFDETREPMPHSEIFHSMGITTKIL